MRPCHSKAYGIWTGAGGRASGCAGKTDFTWYYGGISPQFDVQGLDALPEIDPVQMEDFKAEAEEEIQLQLNL